MASSSNPSDKFAFLLSGTINARFTVDLQNVFDMLTQYYGFQADHIWISHGGALSGSFTGANLKLITSASDLSAEIAKFKAAVSDEDIAYPTSAEKNTGVIYVTGECNASGDYKITNGGVTVGSDWFSSSNFDMIVRDNCELVIVLQNSYSDNMKGQLTGMPQDGCIIYSNPGTDEGHTNPAGSYFTNAWIAALKLVPLPSTGTGLIHPNAYADTLGSGTDATDFLVSMSESTQYAVELLATQSRPEVPQYEYFTLEKSYFLGKPEFLIRDGDNINVGWWESPDIYLTHFYIAGKVDDLYIPDLSSDTTSPWNNTINVVFRNIGTHPVRCFNLGIQIFRTPLNTTPPSPPTLTLTGQDTGTVLKPTILKSDGTFSNTNMHLYSWDNPFYEGVTHECIRAKVQLPDVPIDFIWNVLVNNSEAQRNTDQSSDPPKNANRTLPGDALRGNITHRYSIYNPFNETHTFMITTIPEYQKSLNSVVMKWFVVDKNNKPRRQEFEKIENGFKGYPFVLKGGETMNLLGEFGFKVDAKKKKVRLPVEILVDRICGNNTRTPLAPSLKGKFAAIAGFTIVLINEPANLICSVADKKRNPLPGAIVKVMTVNGLAHESFIANKAGEVVLKNINPDVYRINAIVKESRSEDKIVPLTGGETVKIKLEIIPGKKKNSVEIKPNK